MDRTPINISWDDLKSEGVEARLREEASVRATKEHYDRAAVVAPKIVKPSGLRAWLVRSVVYLTFFGILGGIVGWGAGEALSFRRDRDAEARGLVADLARVDRAEQTGHYTAAAAADARARLYELGAGNPRFNALIGASAGKVEERERLTRAADRHEEFIADLLLFAAGGACIAIALASADRVVEGDWQGAAIDAFIGSVIGIAGGVGVAFAAGAIDAGLLGAAPDAAPLASRMLARAAEWTLLGAFLAAAPGVAMRSGKRMLVGIAGGLVGGLVGGGLFEPIADALGNATASRLIGLAVIGGASGLAIGWLEGFAKQGWLRVASGLIAGKQFILYRNPTFVGSAPMSHIYLFRDPKVGRRHAAIFHVTGGFEIENLPLGGATLVNGQPVARQRLRNGDAISIGRTTLVFEERATA